MFRFTSRAKDTVTLFHKASSPASVRVLAALKQAAAQSSESATEDQAGDHSAQNKTQQQRTEFELDVTEDAPTEGQLQTILEYAGQSGVGSLVNGASSVEEAIKRVRENKENLQRPLVVDWHNGKAAAGDESQILRMLKELKKA